jgi:tetratricopeptide (TPR) repeat protein
MSSRILEYSALEHEGFTLPLELDLEEDIETEIHHFVKLARMGDYAVAHEFFDCTLRQHDHFFPVVVEYADMLLEQGCYRRAAEYLDRRIKAPRGPLVPDEMQLLRLMNSLANIYCKGAVEYALEETERARESLEHTAQQICAGFTADTSNTTPPQWNSYINLYSDVQVSFS